MIERDGRDGPTKAFQQHHDITHRDTGGRRVLTRAERLLRDGTISPEAFDGLRRFSHDYVRGIVGRSTIVTYRVGSSGTYGGPSEDRLDNTSDFREAAEAVDRVTVGHVRASDILILLAVDDVSMREIERRLGVEGNHPAAKKPVKLYSETLAEHYERVDRDRRRSSTPFTREAALALVEPRALQS